MTDLINKDIEIIEGFLKTVLPVCEGELEKVPQMLDYSLDGGGKRIRPVLCLEFCRALAGDVKAALYPACAVEYIHTYSLIHDDLPCMDNDDFRRGKPSSHKQFGEANALLAGDALLTRAFGIISDAAAAGEISCEAAVAEITELSRYAGVNGMIGGQYIDLYYENRAASADVLFLQDSLKTSALIEAACVLGVIAAGGGEEAKAKAREFGLNLGLAFQIEDDLIEYDDGDLSDEKNGKATYIGMLGYEGAKKAAAEYTEKAVDSLGFFGEDAAEIKKLASLLLTRKK